MSRRLNALVIGNAAYEAVDALKNPVNDAGDVGAKLESCGFTVIRCLDSDHAGMDRTLKKFQARSKGLLRHASRTTMLVEQPDFSITSITRFRGSDECLAVISSVASVSTAAR